MRFFIDCEFNAEIGPQIELISIGIAAEDGRNYYAVSSEFDPDKCSDWVKKHVFPKLGPEEFVTNIIPAFPSIPKTLIEMRREIKEFVGTKQAQFWGFYAAWDWLLLGQHIMEGMLSLPANWRHLCMDVKQWQIQSGAPEFPPLPNTEAHNALNDAIWTRDYYKYLERWTATNGGGGDFF